MPLEITRTLQDLLEIKRFENKPIEGTLKEPIKELMLELEVSNG